MKLPSTKTTLTIIVVVIYTITLTTLLATVLRTDHNLLMPSLGTIYALGFQVYGGNITTANEKPTLDWGTTYVGASTNVSFNILSRSNIDVKMNMTSPHNPKPTQ
jgi:hypothetical protein